MKKVKFLKNHVNGIKKGDTGEFNTGRADYLVRIGAAEYVQESGSEPKQKVGKKKASAKSEPCKTC